MVEVLQANWFLILAALVIGLLVAWWILVASRRTKVQIEEKDEAGGKTARRNQALIDSPPAAAAPPKPADTQDMEAARTEASPGPMSAAANADTTAAAPLGTDAETGDGVPLREAMKKSPANATQPVPEGSDDLRRIKGVGPKLVTLLAENGVTTFAQIAAWSDADIERIDAKLGRFQGRIRRDSWVEQARLLEAGDFDAYQARFGRTA